MFWNIFFKKIKLAMQDNKTEKASFTEIRLNDVMRKKVPKRLLYFSDGILEEYSTDEEDEFDHKNQESQSLIDPKTLPWFPYFGYLMMTMGTKTLAVCDYLGEHLAWFFGITSPKFQYELDQFEQMEKEEKDLQEHIKSENAGWVSNSLEQGPETVTIAPLTEKTPMKESAFV